jgi:hypothetical protein
MNNLLPYQADFSNTNTATASFAFGGNNNPFACSFGINNNNNLKSPVALINDLDQLVYYYF